MERDLGAASSREFDLVVVGGGIFGICAAWDATLRGLRVALLERGDFGQGASASCFKMIHGGVRYLQHLDLVRMRHSARERRILLRIAPHLAAPLPILVPTYGHGMRGKEILGAGLKAYDWLTPDRNRGIADPARRIPPARFVSAREARERFPGLDAPGLTGGALFHDGQMYSPARLALAFLRAATGAGAIALNYAEVTGLLRRGEGVDGVRARDRASGEPFEVRGRVVLNASGGWSPRLLRRLLGRGLEPEPSFSRDAYLVVRRSLSPDCALAVSGSTRDPDAVFSRQARHLFLVPWRGRTLVGVWHAVHRDDPDRVTLTEAEIDAFLAETNAAYSGFELRREDVALAQWGLVLFGENRAGARDLRFGKRSRLVDHGRSDGVPGLLSLLGIRYTTARADARAAVDAAFAAMGRRAPPCRTAEVPVHGGDIPDFETFAGEAVAREGARLGEGPLRALLRSHGSAYRDVIGIAEGRPHLRQPIEGTDTLRAELVHAARAEMARRLEDAVFRRTGLGTVGSPGEAALREAAALMGAELGWSEQRTKDELEAVRGAFPAGEEGRGAAAEGIGT